MSDEIKAIVDPYVAFILPVGWVGLICLILFLTRTTKAEISQETLPSFFDDDETKASAAYQQKLTNGLLINIRSYLERLFFILMGCVAFGGGYLIWLLFPIR